MILLSKESLNTFKESKEVLYIYRLPCSLNNMEFEYIIIGNIPKEEYSNVRFFTLDEWFERLKSGSLLVTVCSTLNKANKIKEFVNIYEKPTVWNLRHFISNIKDEKELIQECLWGEQLIKEGKVNRIDVFKNKYFNSKDAIQRFYNAADSIYKMNLENDRKN